MMIFKAKTKTGSQFQDDTASDIDEELKGRGGEVIRD